MVNRIAAGEIIIAPANALKEMLENSIDAGSTAIDILVKDGGLKLLQISDNGSGIEKDDLAILCQRFTTSKLRDFEDLSKLTTYGFRGEALSSISHIAHLTVTTKTRDSPCAWKVAYNDGKPTTDAPAPVAGKNGTLLVVEDLFFNIPSRRRAFKSPAEEFGRVLDVIGRYAIHCTQASFSCKKYGDLHPSLIVSSSTAATSSKSKAPEVDRIRQVYGSAIANELVEVNIPAKPEYGFLGGKGQITGANYSTKKSTPPVFFINHRSVASDPLRRALLQGVYARHLPRGGHAFVYLALDFDPRNLDVNVHPTKREVRFLYDEEIIEHICQVVQEVLASQGSSRTFQTQTILATSGISASSIGGSSGIAFSMDKRAKSALGEGSSGAGNFAMAGSQDYRDNSAPFSQPQKKQYEYKMVRTDAHQQTLPTMFREAFHNNVVKKKTTSKAVVVDEDDFELEEESSFGIPTRPASKSGEDVRPSGSDDNHIPTNQLTQSRKRSYSGNVLQYVDRPRADVRLRSVRELKKELEEHVHNGLTQVLAEHTYIGVVDYRRRLAAFQHKVKVYIVDYGTLSQAIFYQSALAEFSNLGTVTLHGETENNDEEKEEDIGELGIKVADVLDREDSQYDESQITALWQMREMIEEYFSIRFATEEEVEADSQEGAESVPPSQAESQEKGEANGEEDGESPVDEFWRSRIVTLPMILKGYAPPIAKLPIFLDRLLTQITYNDEKECFRGILQELARFYAPEPILDGNEEELADSEYTEEEKKEAAEFRAQRREAIADSLEHYIFPAVKHRLLAPRGLMKDVVEIANLPGLYKVFERC